VAYVWDPIKAATNLDKHGVDFADAVVALEDELALSMPDPFAGSETRFIALGRTPSAAPSSLSTPTTTMTSA
jgi:uncharacterized protein